MIHIKEKELLPGFFEIEGEPQIVSDIRYKILNKFKDLEFIEKTHQYFIPQEDGTKLELNSVSKTIHQFEEPFDTEGQAEKYAIKHGMTKEYWINQWKYNSLKATTLGTQVHLFGECMSYVKNGISYMIPDEFKYRYVEENNWLIPIHPKEEAALKFWNEWPKDLWYVLAETKVYTNKYAGTFDLLAYYKHPTDDNKSGLVILDWKTNKELMKDFSRTFNKMLLPPLEDMFAEPLGLYTGQLSAYQIPLEDMGFKVIARRLILLKEDGNYELIALPNKTKELRDVLDLKNS